jgi:hypothetical protein
VQALKYDDESKTRSILKIDSVTIDDQGRYRCVSGNGIEADLVKEVNLIVKGMKKSENILT